MKENSIFEKYIKENRNDIIVYFIVFLVVTVILFIIGKITNFYYIMLLDIFLINTLLSKISTKFNLKRIEKYVYNNNFSNKIGKIEYWNEYDYFLTEKYIILVEKKNVVIVDYNDIEFLYYKNDIHLNQINSYIDRELYIILKNKKEYKFLTGSTLLTNEKTRDIGSYLKSKNNRIKTVDKNQE